MNTTLLWQLAFWFSGGCLCWTYLGYPVFIKWLAQGRINNPLKNNNTKPCNSENTDLCLDVVVIMAAYNEEKVLEAKLDSIFNTQYPDEKLTVWVASDCSTDGTNTIVKVWQQQHPEAKLFLYEAPQRSGKINLVNTVVSQLSAQAKDDSAFTNTILLLTDANVLFTPATINELIIHFANPEVGMVGANIINHQVAKSGISYQEKWYIQRENQIKYHESLWGGCMIGAFGGCFALRASLYTPVPSHFRVDDLFLTLQIFEQNKKALFEPAAICYEDLPQNMPEELRRKRRIASGNFQNLAKFARLILPAYKKVAICFLSHKVLRWIGPFFLIIAWAASLFLYQHHLFYKMAFWLQTIGFGFPFIELLLQRFETSNKFVRFIAYFYQANLALLLGFFQYLKGVKTSVWKPTERTL